MVPDVVGNLGSKKKKPTFFLLSPPTPPSPHPSVSLWSMRGKIIKIGKQKIAMV